MDVSFTNVLEDARPYFQGLPSPVAAAAAAAATAATAVVATSTSSSAAPAANSSQQHQLADNPAARYAQSAASGAAAPPSVLAYWSPPTTQTSPGPAIYQRAKEPQLYGSAVYNGARLSGGPEGGGYQMPARSQGGGGHNLPPIAALSNYHSSRTSRLNHHQPAKPPPAPQQQQQYGEMHYGHRGVAKYQQHGGVVAAAPPVTSSTSSSSPAYSAYTVVSSTLATTTSPSSAYQTSSHQQYAYSQHHAQQTAVGEAYGKMDQQQPKLARQQYPNSQMYYGTMGTTRSVPTSVQQHNTSMQNGHTRLAASSSTTPTTVVNTVVRNAPPASGSRSKRESPLDLSVKTVRQSADSTAKDDTEGMYGLSSFSPTISGCGGGGSGGGKVIPNHMRNHVQQPGVILPSLQLPSSVPYSSFERSSRQSQGNAPPVAPTSTVGAPKVDFLPNFNASHHSSSQQLEMVRNSNSSRHHQQLYSTQSQVLPHVGSIKKSSSTTTTTSVTATTTTASMMNSHHLQYYPTTVHTSQQHRTSTDCSSGSNMHPPYSVAGNHQYLPSSYETGKKASEPLTGYNKGRLDYADVHGPNHMQMYTSIPPLGQKRMSESARHSVAAKVPKIDSWRDAIDQQIEQRLSSYTNAKAQQQLQQQQQQSLHLQQQQSQQHHQQQHLQQQHHQVNGVLVNSSPTSHILEQQYSSQQHRQSLPHQSHQHSNHLIHHGSATSRSPMAATTPNYNSSIPHQNTSPYASSPQQQQQHLQLHQHHQQQPQKQQPQQQNHQPQRQQQSPLHQPPLQQSPLHQPPLQKSPLHQPPLQQSPLHQPPVQQSPLHQPPLQQSPLHQPPLQQSPLHQPPLQQSPLHQLPVQQSQLHQPPLQQSQLHQPPLQQSQLHQPPLQQSQLHQPPLQQSQLHQPPLQQSQLHQPSLQQSQLHQPSLQQSQLHQPPLQQSSQQHHQQHHQQPPLQSSSQQHQHQQHHQHQPLQQQQQHQQQLPYAIQNNTPLLPPRGNALQQLLMSSTAGGGNSGASSGVADKRVLSVLRTSLGIREARINQLQNELQQRQRQKQMSQYLAAHQPQVDVQQKAAALPTSNTTASRPNVPTYSLEDNHVLPMHKLHLPRAVDSICLESETQTAVMHPYEPQKVLHRTEPDNHTNVISSTNSSIAVTTTTSNSSTTNSGDLDGLAAYLAARIRTKAELKQVGPSMDQLNITSQNQFRSSTPASSISASNSSVHSPRTTPGTPVVFSSPPPQHQQQQQQQLAHSSSEAVESEQTPHSCSTTSSSGMTSLSSVGTSLGSSPPKLTRERVNVSVLPRRRLFSRPDEEPGGSNITTAVVSLAPPRDPSGLRSSSETSVFDFRDSDSESEMPVLERQTLDEMRRDRKSHTKHQAQIPVAEFGDPGSVPVGVKEEVNKEVDQKVLVSDPLWANMCDDFVEELKHGANRVKRWVRLMHSKTSPFVETVSSIKEENISIKVEIKEEKADSPLENQDDACEYKPEEKEVVVKQENNAKVIVQNSVETQNVIVVNNDILKMNESASESKTSVIKKELTAKNDGEVTKKVKTDKKEKLVEKKEKNIYNKDSVCDKKGKQMEEKEKFTEKKEKSCDKGKALDKSKVKTTIKKEKLREKIKLALGKIEKTFQKKDKALGSKNLKINNKADNILNKIENSSSKEKKRKQDDSDEDLPLVRRSRGRPRKKSVPEKEADKDVEDEISLAEMKARLVKVETCRDASIDRSSRSEGCDSDYDEQTQTMAQRLRRRKCQSKLGVGMKLRSKDSATPKKPGSAEKKLTLVKKNQFGDMSDFQPGWAEEVYSYKRSLRMPPKLISIPRPSNRLCSSLPDLDAPLHSPAASTLDSFDFSPQRRGTDASNLLSSHHTWSSVRSEMADSDLDSNSNFSSNWSLPQRSWNIAPDSEEASSSTTFSTKNKCKIGDNSYALLNRIASKLSSSSAKDKSSPDAKDNGKNSPCIFTRSNSNTPELLLRNDSSCNKSRKPNKKHTFTKSDGKEVRRNCLKEIKKVCDSEDLDLVGSCKKDKNSQSFNNVLRLNSRLHAETDVCVSRTRGRTRVLRRKATIRAVFGADRPASAPPTCREDRLGECCVEGDRLDRTRGEVARKGRGGLNTAVVWNSKTVSGSKRRLLLTKQRHGHSLLKMLSPKKLLSDGSNMLSKNSRVFGEGDVGVRVQLPGRTITGKRIKLRTVRRKFRSGFDYIRKKKKQQKKDGDGDCPKEKKKFVIPRPSSESVQDIQNEIRGWVINKGLGETLLHRAARLGYTDVAAYCLEVLDNHPSPRDNAGYTPLHNACARGHLEIARLLLMYGANVSDSAPGGLRPLHEVADNGFVELIRLLLSYGADPLLATYSGHTPLSLASEETSRFLLQYHLADVQGLPAPPWQFLGPSTCCDPKEYGYDPITEPPGPVAPAPDDADELEIETCEVAMPVLYRLCNEPASDRWVLLQDLTSVLRFKSRDAVLRQLSTDPSIPPKSIFRELKMADFLEQARCCNLLGAGERINIRASKVALVKYTDKVRELLGIEKTTVSLR